MNKLIFIAATLITMSGCKSTYNQHDYQGGRELTNKLRVSFFSGECPGMERPLEMQHKMVNLIFEANKTYWKIDDYRNEPYLASIDRKIEDYSKVKLVHSQFDEAFNKWLEHPTNKCLLSSEDQELVKVYLEPVLFQIIDRTVESEYPYTKTKKVKELYTYSAQQKINYIQKLSGRIDKSITTVTKEKKEYLARTEERKHLQEENNRKQKEQEKLTFTHLSKMNHELKLKADRILYGTVDYCFKSFMKFKGSKSHLCNVKFDKAKVQQQIEGGYLIRDEDILIPVHIESAEMLIEGQSLDGIGFLLYTDSVTTYRTVTGASKQKFNVKVVGEYFDSGVFD